MWLCAPKLSHTCYSWLIAASLIAAFSLRYAAAALLGALVTLGVLFTMQILIAAPRARLDESGTRHFVDFVRVQREETVQRAERIRVRALGRDGQPFEWDLDGLLAVCVQHEIDHLDGKLFVDYLSEGKRMRIRKKLVKEEKHRSAEAIAL